MLEDVCGSDSSLTLRSVRIKSAMPVDQCGALPRGTLHGLDIAISCPLSSTKASSVRIQVTNY
eukprot:scaffold294425_cov79-Cyclotella_meneghiniana.AAC.2